MQTVGGMDSILNSRAGEKLDGKKDELKGIAQSEDGRKVQAMLDGDKMKRALEAGDMETLKSAVQNVMQTDEGARLYAKLSELMK